MLQYNAEQSDDQLKDYIEEPILAKSLLEDELRNRRRSIGNIVRACHILEIPYWTGYRMDPKDVHYDKRDDSWVVILLDTDKIVTRIVEVSSDQVKPLLAWFKVRKKPDFWTYARLIRACIDKLGIYYDVKTKTVRGFVKEQSIDFLGYNGD